MLAFSAFVSAQTVSNVIEVKKLPATRYIRSRDFDTKHIALDLKFDWSNSQTSGVERFTFAPLKNDFNKLVLDAGAMVFNSVKLATGKDLEFFYDEPKELLTINLDRTYRYGEEVTVIIDYRTKGEIVANTISVPTLTNDTKFSELYFAGLKDRSYSVVEQSALGPARTKNAKAFDTLSNLLTQPSWKGRIQIAALNGLAQLKDKKSLDLGIKYAADQNLPPNIRSAALKIVGATGKGDLRAYPIIFEAIKYSLDNNDFQGMFDCVQAIINLADPRGQEAFDLLKEKYKNNPQIIGYGVFLESQFKEALKK